MLCWGLLFTSYSASINAQNYNSLDPTQVYNTGNLTTFNQGGSQTTSAWQNVGQWGGSLSCWAPGGPGYCGPQPYVNSNGYGNINFSYGYTDLYQIVNIANALPNSGTGLRVNGFNFGFQAKNGNGWDNGQQDYLVAYVNFYDAKGSVAQAYNYGAYTNQRYNWTYFNFSETFATPYATKDLSTARYGFVGYDSNFWAGPYGPEVNNVSFSLKYSVDPCFVNVLSSPSCPGYLDELAKLNQQSNTTLATISTTPTTSTTITSDPTNPVVTTYSVPTSSSSTAPVVTTTSVSSSSSSERSVSGPSLSTILGIVRAEQSRISAVEGAAVQQANEAASQASNQATTLAESVAQTATQNSQKTATQQTQTNYSLITSSGPTSNGSVVSIGLRGPDFNLQANDSNSNLSSSSPSQQIITSFSSVLRNNSLTQSQDNEIPKVTAIEFVGVSPIKDYLEEKPTARLDPIPPGQRQSEVKRNVQDNEAAGGVTIAAIAKQPSGYDLYMSMALKDSIFYAPKEIYRNQKVVDNERMLRQLNGRSDRLYEEMVNDQYK